MSVAALAAESSSPGTERINMNSVVRLTFDNNLRVAGERHNLEAADLQYQRFIRAQSQFIPLIVDSRVDREVERERSGGRRIAEGETGGEVTVGMEKEFFDGTNVEARVGARGSRDPSGQNTNPFVEVGLELPLFSSFTKLERITERTFEEGEMFSAWLDFLENVRDSIQNSQQNYLGLQQALGRRAIVEQVLADFRTLLQDDRVTGRPNDLAQVRTQVQSFQSNLASQQSRIDAQRINLLDSIGFEAMTLEQVEPMDIHAQNFYGAAYLAQDPAAVVAESLKNDVEARVLEVRRRNEELKRDLAQKGKWDIVGRVTGGYDFRSRGDDRSEPMGYRTGIGLSVRRNDPHLLQLSLRQSAARIRKLEADIEFRRRQVTNEIRRHLGDAASRRTVIRELQSSRELRRGVYEQKRAAYLAGSETMDNLIQAREQLFDAEDDLLNETVDFYYTIIELDEGSGQYFVQLGDAVPKFESPATE